MWVLPSLLPVFILPACVPTLLDFASTLTIPLLSLTLRPACLLITFVWHQSFAWALPVLLPGFFGLSCLIFFPLGLCLARTASVIFELLLNILTIILLPSLLLSPQSFLAPPALTGHHWRPIMNLSHYGRMTTLILEQVMLFIHKAEIKKPLTCVSKWADAILFLLPCWTCCKAELKFKSIKLTGKSKQI